MSQSKVPVECEYLPLFGCLAVLHNHTTRYWQTSIDFLNKQPQMPRFLHNGRQRTPYAVSQGQRGRSKQHSNGEQDTGTSTEMMTTSRMMMTTREYRTALSHDVAEYVEGVTHWMTEMMMTMTTHRTAQR